MYQNSPRTRQFGVHPKSKTMWKLHVWVILFGNLMWKGKGLLPMGLSCLVYIKHDFEYFLKHNVRRIYKTFNTNNKM